MLLLHISDIHFREPQCANPDQDPTRPYRTRLLQSVRDEVVKLGPVDAILVGGDIAFKGDPEEYVAARKWFDELAEAAGNASAPLFVVPGNHDVDQRIISARRAVQNAQAAIANARNAAAREPRALCAARRLQ
jgi:3',5'-cyclic AMP phosphodiesterase CpdA